MVNNHTECNRLDMVCECEKNAPRSENQSMEICGESVHLNKCDKEDLQVLSQTDSSKKKKAFVCEKIVF